MANMLTKSSKMFFINLNNKGVKRFCLPEKIAEYYLAIQNPGKINKTYSKALKEFTSTTILAFECGLSENYMRNFVKNFPKINIDMEDECFIDFLALVWITLIICKKNVYRWSNSSPVSEETFSCWYGFVSLIVVAYFEKKMSWYPIEYLQTEIFLKKEKLESPCLVAEKAKIVFMTLEIIAPQFPSI